ncbi:MAG: Glu-tRNA(Gln) amidotransferase subunit GatD [Candidatus Aenigmarchaeota archaeon]|nr:Glu-tRNA(Gln) amidotransferase subunit GatD [Candidatus Aenigmarchaeota archaeon]
MYSNAVRKRLRSAGVSVGKRILVEKEGKKFEGLLMPKTDFSDPDSLAIKLDNGYNIGIKLGKDVKIRKSRHREPKSILEEEKLETGKISRKLLKVKWDKSKPPVTLMSVGGTISSRVDYRTGGVYALESPEEILHNVPELSGIVNLKMEKPFNKMSEDMGPDDWARIARLAAKELNSGSHGVIITHGTDFLHYTAMALSFFLQNLSKPVVLVGSQRSSDRGSSDAGMNLICASHVAKSDIAEVGICMHGSLNDDYCLFSRGTKVRKMHTSRRDAFRPINEPPLARVWPDGRIEVKNSNIRNRTNDRVKVDSKFEPKVAMLKVYPGADPKIIDYYISKNYKGFVLEVPGLGHVPTTVSKKPWTTVIKKHAKDGIPFVCTPQTIYGRINPYVYTNLRLLYLDAGAIPGEDMLPETAYVKLCWVLGHTKKPEEVRKMMLTNYAGEITKRTEIENSLGGFE